MRQFLVLFLLAAALLAPGARAEDRVFALGDTLTLIERPLLNLPAIVAPGETLQVSCQSASDAGPWEAALRYGSHWLPLELVSADYDAATLWWTLRALVPEPPVHELYDLYVRTEQGGGLVEDISENAVRLLPSRRDDWYFIHITDTHLPDARFSDSGGQPSDSTEIVDLREVIKDINFLNPEFVLHTGDLVNEGELEDYMEWRQYSRAQRLLAELQVPVYLVGGNHDLGGWDDTPPPDGTARRNWWRFFGWPRLDDPPAGAPERTQNYSFDYGPVHFSGLEAYINYDYWRYSFYGYYSFTNAQMDWLDADLAATDRDAKVLFYHKDFTNEIDLSALDVDMALWGHIHHDSGDIHDHPYDRSTAATGDGDRAYRVIRVSDGVLTPRETVSAGDGGDNVLASYSPANDGTHYTMSALVSNLHPMPFEHCLLKFVMPADGTNPQLSNGSLVQVDERDGVKVYYVEVNMPAGDWHTVVLQLDEPTGISDHAPGAAILLGNFPNPFNPRTEIRFALAQDGPARLAIHDAAGRQLRLLADGRMEAGAHQIGWDGRDGEGLEMPSGLYLARLSGPGIALSHKMLLLR